MPLRSRLISCQGLRSDSHFGPIFVAFSMDNSNSGGAPLQPNNGFILRALSLSSSAGGGAGGSLPSTPNNRQAHSPLVYGGGSKSSPSSPNTIKGMTTQHSRNHPSSDGTNILDGSDEEHQEGGAIQASEMEGAVTSPTVARSKRPAALSIRGLQGKACAANCSKVSSH